MNENLKFWEGAIIMILFIVSSSLVLTKGVLSASEFIVDELFGFREKREKIERAIEQSEKELEKLFKESKEAEKEYKARELIRQQEQERQKLEWEIMDKIEECEEPIEFTVKLPALYQSTLSNQKDIVLSNLKDTNVGIVWHRENTNSLSFRKVGMIEEIINITISTKNEPKEFSYKFCKVELEKRCDEIIKFEGNCSEAKISDYNKCTRELGSFEMKWCNRAKQDIDYMCSEEYFGHFKESFKEEKRQECEEEKKVFIYDCICPAPNFEQVQLKPFGEA